MEIIKKTNLITKLDLLPKLNWNNFDEVSNITQKLLKELTDDKKSLRELVYRVENDEKLLADCECHELLERIELYNGIDRGFRLRFNFSTEVQSLRPHDHRYSFSTYIARGTYKHIWFSANEEIYDGQRDDEVKQWIDKQNPDADSNVNTRKMNPLFIADENKKACYTIHHSAVHATITEPETVSLFLRGPGEKVRSLIADRETNKIWWRFGRENEKDKRITSKKMPLERYYTLRAKLEDWGLI